MRSRHVIVFMSVAAMALTACSDQKDLVSPPQMASRILLPPPPPPPDPNELISITAGLDHTCAARRNGKLYCWGDNDAGQLGLGHLPQLCGGTQFNPDTECALRPTQVLSSTFSAA